MKRRVAPAPVVRPAHRAMDNRWAPAVLRASTRVAHSGYGQPMHVGFPVSASQGCPQQTPPLIAEKTGKKGGHDRYFECKEKIMKLGFESGNNSCRRAAEIVDADQAGSSRGNSSSFRAVHQRRGARCQFCGWILAAAG